MPLPSMPSYGAGIQTPNVWSEAADAISNYPDMQAAVTERKAKMAEAALKLSTAETAQAKTRLDALMKQAEGNPEMLKNPGVMKLAAELHQKINPGAPAPFKDSMATQLAGDSSTTTPSTSSTAAAEAVAFNKGDKAGGSAKTAAVQGPRIDPAAVSTSNIPQVKATQTPTGQKELDPNQLTDGPDFTTMSVAEKAFAAGLEPEWRQASMHGYRNVPPDFLTLPATVPLGSSTATRANAEHDKMLKAVGVTMTGADYLSYLEQNHAHLIATHVMTEDEYQKALVDPNLLAKSKTKLAADIAMLESRGIHYSNADKIALANSTSLTEYRAIEGRFLGDRSRHMSRQDDEAVRTHLANEAIRRQNAETQAKQASAHLQAVQNGWSIHLAGQLTHDKTQLETAKHHAEITLTETRKLLQKAADGGARMVENKDADGNVVGAVDPRVADLMKTEDAQKKEIEGYDQLLGSLGVALKDKDKKNLTISGMPLNQAATAKIGASNSNPQLNAVISQINSERGSKTPAEMEARVKASGIYNDPNTSAADKAALIAAARKGK